MNYYDSYGVRIRKGAVVHFSYGIPPIGVDAKIVQRDGKLVALTPGHNPDHCALRSLKRFVGDIYVKRPDGS